METLIDDLKARARILHDAVDRAEPEAIARVRKVRELKALYEGDLVKETKRRHCLSAIALELGFGGWPHLVSVVTGVRDDDFGTLLYPDKWSSFWNIWSAHYDEAKEIRAQHGGFLLAYKKHFFITEGYFVDSLGVPANDPDWERIGRDWAKPGDVEARARLYAKVIEHRFPRTPRPMTPQTPQAPQAKAS